MQPNYANTVIYIIRAKNKNNKNVYIGHTTDFVGRKAKHKYRCNHLSYLGSRYPLYEYIRQHGGWDKFQMEILEHYPCNTRKEAMERENYYYNLLQAKLNGDEP